MTEMHEDPSKVTQTQFPYQHVPQVFLFSHRETEHLDKETAYTLAWKLRGLALVFLIHRESPAVNMLTEFNAAYRLPGKAIEYLTLHNFEEVLDLFTNKDTKEAAEEEEGEEIEDFEDEDFSDQLDDEVAASVYLKRGNELDMDVFTELNTHNFHSVVAQSSLTVALFYLKWDAVSMAFLEPFVEVAEGLLDAGIDDVQMCAVNCGEWTDLCGAQSGTPRPLPFQPIINFPTIMLLRSQEPAQNYKGMLSSQALYHFILLSRVDSPLKLQSEADVNVFMSGVIHPDLSGRTTDKALGLFDTRSHPGVSVFAEAAKALRGELLTGLLMDGLALKWALDHKVDLPAVLVFPSWQTDDSPSVLPLPSSATELMAHLNTALLQTMPELTVANLPTFLSLGKALLLLFVGEEEDEIGQKQNKALVGELRKMAEMGGPKMEKYLPCWIHLGRTPAGIHVLGSYLGSVPPLPSLILTHNPSAAEIYQYPPRSPIAAASVLQWIQRVEEGKEQAAGLLGEESWPPVASFYDFLAVMDKDDPTSARQQQANQETDGKETRKEDGEVNATDDVTIEEEPVSNLNGPMQHNEL